MKVYLKQVFLIKFLRNEKLWYFECIWFSEICGGDSKKLPLNQMYALNHISLNTSYIKCVFGTTFLD